MIKLTKFLKLLLLASTIASFVACGAKSSTAPSSSPSITVKPSISSKIIPTLKIAVPKDEAPIFREIVSNYKTVSPDINVDVVELPIVKYEKSLFSLLSKSEPIDIFAVNDVAQYISAIDYNYALPITEYVQQDNIDKLFYPDTFNNLKMHNNYYGIPYQKTAYVLYYNKNLFDEIKMSYPKQDMTWSEYRSLAKKMTRMRKGTKLYGAYFDESPQSMLIPLIQKGSSFLEDDLSTLGATINLRKAMEADGSIPKYSQQIKYKSHYNTEFQRGKMAMHINGSWHIKQLIDAKADGRIAFNWDIVPVPHPEKQDKDTSNITIGNISTLVINSKSVSKDVAWNFVKFIGGSGGASVFAKYKILPAYMSSSVQNIYLGNTAPTPINLRILTEQNVRLIMPMNVYASAVLESVVSPAINDTLIGIISTSDCIKKILTDKKSIAK